MSKFAFFFAKKIYINIFWPKLVQNRRTKSGKNIN